MTADDMEFVTFLFLFYIGGLVLVIVLCLESISNKLDKLIKIHKEDTTTKGR